MLEIILHDAKYAVRRLGRAPVFSITLVLTLAMGIGAATAIFSVVYGVLLRPLPYPDADRLTAVWEVNTRGTYSRLADPNFNDFRDQNRSFVGMAKYTTVVTSVVGPAEPTRSFVTFFSRGYFQVLGIRPAIGRAPGPDESRPGAAPVALASHRYWREHLSSTTDLAGVKLRIQDKVYAVIGVLPEGVEFPAKADLWAPSELDEDNPSRTSHNYFAIGRLRPGVTAAQAAADLDAIARRIARQSSEQGEYLLRGAAAVPLRQSQTATVRSPLLILLGAVGVLLLVACATVANFLLAEASARARELGVRSALGAGRARLVRQFVTEASVLCAAGATLGVLIAGGLLRGLLALAPASLPRLAEVSISWPVLAFTAGISFGVAVCLGVVTALRATKAAPGSALLEAGRGSAGSARGQRLGRGIVAAQLAMTLTLLTAAGLLGRSLLKVLSVDPGFRTDGVVVADLELPDPGDLKPDERLAFRARQSQFVSQLILRLHGIPGVRQVAASNGVPLDGGPPDGMFLLVDPEENPKNFDEFSALARQEARRGTADFRAATPEYFQTLGIQLRRGRLFDGRDRFDGPHAAVITESLARRQWPNRDAIGRTIQFGNMDGDLHLLTVVGVVADTNENGLEQPQRPTVYVNLLQRPRMHLSIVMRADGDASQVITAARAVLRTEARDVPPRFRTFDEIYAASTGSRRFSLMLVGAFAITALFLAVGGVYGTVAYGAARRTREIGLRVALGATAPDVSAMILAQGLRTTVVGVAAGVIGSFAAARAIRSLLFGIEPTDPLTFAAVAALLSLVAALACYLPARRAARVDPLVALRTE